jgi:hypothetical protein
MTTQSNENAHRYLSEPRRSMLIFGCRILPRPAELAPDLPVLRVTLVWVGGCDVMQ